MWERFKKSQAAIDFNWRLVVDKLLRFELESLSPPINIPRNQFVDCARIESIIYRFANEKV